jgi:hypothetical protein
MGVPLNVHGAAYKFVMLITVMLKFTETIWQLDFPILILTSGVHLVS